MRCKICDWSPNMPNSIFKSGLSISKTPPNAKKWNYETSTYDCDLCSNRDEEVKFSLDYSELDGDYNDL